jgi:hypothetical protein
MLLQVGLGAATGRGRPAPRQRGTDPEPGRTGPASGATTRHWLDARSTALPARAARPGSGCRRVARQRAGPWCAGPRPGVPVLAARGHAPNPRSSRLATPLASSTSSSPDSVTSSCSWQLPGQPPSPTNGRHGRWTPPSPGRCGRGVWRRPDLLVGPSTGSLHPGREPVNQDRLAGGGHLPQALAQVGKGGDERPVGLAVRERGEPREQQIHAVADLGLGDPDHPTVQQDRGDGVQADRQGERWVATDPWRSRSQQVARRPASQVRTRRAATNAGRMTRGPDLLGSGEGLLMVRPHDRHTQHRGPRMHPAGPGRCPTVPGGPWEPGWARPAADAGR